MLINQKEDFVKLEEIEGAKIVLEGKVFQTPLIPFHAYEKSANLFLKVEAFQKTGSFKIRGALNSLHHLSEIEKKKGIITISAGNHAKALAFAAQIERISATVVMPISAPINKINATKELGAKVILNNPQKSGLGLLEEMQQIQKINDLTLVHPFDDKNIIAGQGTIALEILKDLPDVDIVIIPIGGGGLISGIATALKEKNPNILVYGVEPVGANAMSQSLMQNKVITLDKIDTIADGLAAPFAGKLTLKHVQKYVDKIVEVTDDVIKNAIRLVLEETKISVEPAGGASLAALESGKIPYNSNDKIVCLLSGGNIDFELLKSII